jgi:type I restriction enzyme S subunit
MSELKKLGDFAVIGSGYAFSSDAFSEDGIPIIRMSDLCNGFVDIKHAARVSQTKGLDGFKLNQGDFLIGMSGSLDAYGVVGADVSTAYLNQRVGRLIIKDSKKAHYGFFAKVLSSDAYRKYVYREGIGAAQLNISSKQIECFEMFVPEYDIQKKIFQILDTIDTAIQQTQAIINKLKQLKQGLLHDLLTRGVGANGELRPCYEDAPHLYKESPLGWIPKEWEVKKLDSISSTVTSGSRDWARFYADTGALFIRIGNLTREHINFRYDSVIYVNPPANGDGQRTKLEAGDILISITADLGIIGVMSDRMGEAYINQHISLVRPVHKDVNSRFIGHYLCTSQAQNYISKLNDGGAKSGLNLPTIRSLEVSLPLSRVEQDCIATQLDNIDNQIQTSKQELEKLKSTKLGVMDDLLTGRIRVTSLLQTEASSV